MPLSHVTKRHRPVNIFVSRLSDANPPNVGFQAEGSHIVNITDCRTVNCRSPPQCRRIPCERPRATQWLQSTRRISLRPSRSGRILRRRTRGPANATPHIGSRTRIEKGGVRSPTRNSHIENAGSGTGENRRFDASLGIEPGRSKVRPHLAMALQYYVRNIVTTYSRRRSRERPRTGPVRRLSSPVALPDSRGFEYRVSGG